jgi:serine/threonine protein kinase
MTSVNFSVDSKINTEWAYPENEIVFSDNIIGRGAYGEVRIAKWRNVDVAAKRLHSLNVKSQGNSDLSDADKSAIAESFRSEMTTLSKLRHPNLVLFLGISYNSRLQPTAILTELMTASLYDILENQKIKLTLPEILDIAIDVISGLEYLHGQVPHIVHRDISCKNILLEGNRAKIADLGQAKIFDTSVLSRQTSMPGAMAYSAPEVLTGKYSTKIDIFSFGVLLAQMCCGEYPRIERREDQLSRARSSQPPLNDLLTSTMSFQPIDRPPATAISDILKSIASNDRFYPPLRRISPQRDIGIMARRWMAESIDERCKDVQLSLEHTSRRLTVEEQRWREEAAKLEASERSLMSCRSEMAAVTDSNERYKREMESMKHKIDSLEQNLANSELREKQLIAENNLLAMTNSEHVLRIDSLRSELSISASTITQQKIENDRLAADMQVMQIDLENHRSSEESMKMHLNMQVDHCRELETRLEQALVRWKLEKEMVVKETDRCAKLRTTCGEFVEKNARCTEEIDRLSRRLHLYDSLPMPEEIKERMKDLEEDVRTANVKINELTDNKHALSREIEEYLGTIRNLEIERDELKAIVTKNTDDILARDADVASLREAVDTLQAQNSREVELIVSLQEEKKQLVHLTDTLRTKIKDLESISHPIKSARRRVRTTSSHENDDEEVEEGEEGDYCEEEGDDNAEQKEGEKEDYEDDDFDNDKIWGPKTRNEVEAKTNGLRRHTIRTRLKIVKESEGDVEGADAFREKAVTRLHKFAGNNFGDLLLAAHKTKDHLESLHKVQEETKLQDPLEQRRCVCHSRLRA